MGTSASCTTHSVIAGTNTTDQEQILRPMDYSRTQHNDTDDRPSRVKKPRVESREYDEHSEHSDTLFNMSKAQPQRLGRLPPIDGKQSVNTNVNQLTDKPFPNKRKLKEQKQHIKELEQQIKELEQRIKVLEQRIKELEEETNMSRSEIELLKLQHDNDVIQGQVHKQEADDLRLRMSKMASDRLTENNPNITDLSDENRATNVGEKFSELYSNEWSDIFEELTADGKSEKEAIGVLLEILKMIFEECKRKSKKDIDDIKLAIQACTGCVELNDQLYSSIKLLKRERKRNFKATTPELLTILEIILPNEEKTETKRSYVRTATEICWLMCIHDPPLVFQYTAENNSLKEDYFSPYTKIGDKVDYLVWPALLLHHNGPLVQKGVAQGKN